jgi:hypothetical protein
MRKLHSLAAASRRLKSKRRDFSVWLLIEPRSQAEIEKALRVFQRSVAREIKRYDPQLRLDL